MDLPLNAHRIALIHNEEYMSKKVLYFATSFFLKVDMAFTDPGFALYPAHHRMQWLYPNRWAHGAFVGCRLRQTLLAERNLTALWRVLRGWNWNALARPLPMEKLDIIRLWIRHYYHPAIDEETEDIPTAILGIPWRLIGTANLERRIADPFSEPPLDPLLRPDELVLGECVRRKLKIDSHWVDMMLWGFVDLNQRNYPVLTEEELLNLKS